VRKYRILLVLTVLAVSCCTRDSDAGVVINEFMAKNNATLEDPHDPGE